MGPHLFFVIFFKFPDSHPLKVVKELLNRWNSRINLSNRKYLVDCFIALFMNQVDLVRLSWVECNTGEPWLFLRLNLLLEKIFLILHFKFD